MALRLGLCRSSVILHLLINDCHRLDFIGSLLGFTFEVLNFTLTFGGAAPLGVLQVYPCL